MRNRRIGATSGREAADLVSLVVGSNDILRRPDGDMIAPAFTAGGALPDP